MSDPAIIMVQIVQSWWASAVSVAQSLATIVIAAVGVFIAWKNYTWGKLSQEERRAFHLRKLLREISLVLGKERVTPGPDLAVSRPEKLRKHQLFIPLRITNSQGFDDELTLETSEPTDRWTFRYNGKGLKLELWNERPNATVENPRKTLFSLTLRDCGKDIGDICLNSLDRPKFEGSFRWKMAFKGILIKEGALDIQ